MRFKDIICGVQTHQIHRLNRHQTKLRPNLAQCIQNKKKYDNIPEMKVDVERSAKREIEKNMTMMKYEEEETQLPAIL